MKKTERRIAVSAPVIETIGSEEVVTLIIGGRMWNLVAVDSPQSRHSAAALHMARSISLVLDEDPRFTFPEDHS